jgi:hypothetical protein
MFFIRRPKISVVVLVHRMVREAPRTLYSLTTVYQEDVTANDYEVIVVENPSQQMLGSKAVEQHGRQFRYALHRGDPRSPAAAMNFGASLARGRHLMLMIDGARILSPGVLKRTLAALRLCGPAPVATVSWHLGPDVQSKSIHEGYCQEVEDRLLAGVDWRRDGYRLFEIASLAGSCRGVWFGPVSESNCVTVDRKSFHDLKGFSELFRAAGGGLVNLDFFARVIANSPRQPVLLLGEGTFHQFHGGAATNRADNEPLREFHEEYQRIRGAPFKPPRFHPVLFGHIPKQSLPFMRAGIRGASMRSRRAHPSVQPTGTYKWLKDEARPTHNESGSPSRVLTVLGMHRSGTSCLAGTLMECGVHFGDVSRKNPFNAKGNNENAQIMDLQDRLLLDNGGSWKSPPRYVLWNDEHRLARDQIIRTYSSAGHAWWGFKDPRTLLTLDGWLEKLPDMQCLGIVRHPDAVAQSLSNRNGFSREQGLDLWYQYNRRLLAFQKRRHFPVVLFNNHETPFLQRLEQVISCLGFKMPAGGFTFFEPKLQHFRPTQGGSLPVHVAGLYRELQHVAASYFSPQEHRSFPKAA